MSQWRRERVWWFAYSRLDTVGGVLVLISAAKPAGTPLRARRRPPSRREQTRERCMRRTVFPIPEFTAEDSRRDYSPKVAEGLPTASLHPVRWWAHLEFTPPADQGFEHVWLVSPDARLGWRIDLTAPPDVS